MKRNDLMLVAFAGLILSTPAHAQQEEQYVATHGASVPETYIAVDQHESLHLDLWPDQGFHLLRTSGGSEPEALAGRWHAAGRNLVLPLCDETLRLEVRNAERLRPEGAPDDASGDLVAAGALDPAPIRLRAAGMFTYFADAPTFAHCATGLTQSRKKTTTWTWSAPIAKTGRALRSRFSSRSTPPSPTVRRWKALIVSP